MKRIISAAMAAVLTLSLAACGSSGDELVSRSPFPQFSESDTRGNTVTSDIFADYDATIINFWNNGCGTCIAEMPELEEFYQAFKEKNINLIGVASDSGEGRRTAELIAEAVAGLALGLVKQRETKFELIYLSGGDIAKAFAGLAGMEGVEPQGEISPLAVYGYAAGGEVSGMKILTKGGMIGDRETLHKMLSCVKMINQISVQEEEG